MANIGNAIYEASSIDGWFGAVLEDRQVDKTHPQSGLSLHITSFSAPKQNIFVQKVWPKTKSTAKL